MAVLNYTELDTWKKAMDLVEAIYHATKGFPREEMHGLTGQMRRAAISIPSNIAEGQGRGLPRQFVHHLRIVHGSLRELETQVMIAQRLNYLDTPRVEGLLQLAGEVGRLINGLIRSIHAD